MRRLLLLLLVLTGFLLFAFAESRRDPVVRRATLALADWPHGAPPIRVALVSDLHLGNASTNVARLTRIADQVSGERPDLILIAGDLVAGARQASLPELAGPLSHFHARLGIVAVPGNHDWGVGIDPTREALRRAGIPMLQNQAIARGPLALGGLDDEATGHARPRQVLAALAGLHGARVVIGHTPDDAPFFAHGLVLAGHTHCGQVVLPLIGAPIAMSRYGARYRCGVVREGERTVVIGAGTGTSDVPLRFNAPPDWWLLTLGPRALDQPRRLQPQHHARDAEHRRASPAYRR